MPEARRGSEAQALRPGPLQTVGLQVANTSLRTTSAAPRRAAPHRSGRRAARPSRRSPLFRRTATASFPGLRALRPLACKLF